MKELITQNFFKVLLIIAFICLAFYQWKNEKVYAVKSDAPGFEQISSISDEPVQEALPLNNESN